MLDWQWKEVDSLESQEKGNEAKILLKNSWIKLKRFKSPYSVRFLFLIFIS